MKIFDIINEAKSADLYHTTSRGNKILDSGFIKPYVYRDAEGFEKELGPRISLTRNFHYHYGQYYYGARVCKFAIDQMKLASNQKIKSIDMMVMYGSRRREEAEEYVVNPIPLKFVKYIVVPSLFRNEDFVLKVLNKNIPVYSGDHLRKLRQITKKDVVGTDESSEVKFMNNESINLDEVAVISSWIKDLDYHEGDTYMTLNNGRMYVVKSTRLEVYERWIKAPSKGKFWHSDIKGLYSVRKIR